MEVNETMDFSNTTSGKYLDYGLPVVATLSFFLVTSMILAFFGNIMVIVTILRHRGMRTRTNMLLGNLAVADILVAVLDMPIALVTIINHDWVFPETFCVFNGFAVGLGLMLSVHTLMWISIHKFFSITRPFARNVSQFQIVLMMVSAWAWTILYNLTATPLIGMTHTVYKKGASQCGPEIPKRMSQLIHSILNTFCNLVIPMTVMVFCYYKIFSEVKTHLERMRDFADAGIRNSYIQQKQITVTLLIVLIVFFVFWFPYIVYSMSLVFCGEECVPEVFNPISYLCGYMNSACNPVIYALRSPSFRRGFKEIIFGTSSHISGSTRTFGGTRHSHRGILASFGNSIYRPSVRGRNQPGGSLYAAAPPARAVRVPKISMVACPPLMSPEINGEACRVEPVEVDPGGASKTSPVSISFEVGDHTQPDLPSSSIDAKYYYAPWQPLQQQFPISHLSKSCQEIVTSSSGITTRSASASAILDVNQDMTEMEQESAVTPKYHHKSEVPHSLVMQVSFDHLLSAPPAGRRRKSGQQQFLINHLSRSCQEVATSTSGSMTRSLSSSAGDISNMVTHDTKETQQESGVTSKRRHRSEVHRPLVMQASLDHLSAPPVGKRRRRFADERRSVQQEQAPQQTHLRVRGIVRNIRKSLGDLLKTEEH